jgi:hypothetical protein
MKNNLYMLRVCPICKCQFCVPTCEWVYKVVRQHRKDKPSIIYYCSWTCFREQERRKEVKRYNDPKRSG